MGLFSGDGMRKVPSLDDFSMGTGQDAERELGGKRTSMPEVPDIKRTSIDSQRSNGSFSSSPRTAAVWRDVFNPGKNFSANMRGKEYFDTVSKEGPRAPTTWEYIAKAENLKRASFANFDKNGDGFIDADELRAALGPQASVSELIRQADKNNDGRIDFHEFCEILKHDH